MKLGSLFDGSGGFPLAGSLCGITPVWASEVEPYPIAVTKSRFPEMKHLGSVTDVHGGDIEPVDVITFGSPCQDLSIAGKRAGLKHEANGDEETTRSGLFMEAVRIIKEMRKATHGVYPRFALWENVPGAFSSNKGEDFRIVLEELIKIVEPDAVMPPVPKSGWPYADCYHGDGWSIAYRTLDAQYWGVPQRRRRIYLVLDLRGERAGEVLFEREGLRGYFAEGGTPRKGASGDAESCAGAADRAGERVTPYALKIRSGCEGGGKGALIQTDKSATLSTLNDQYLFQPVDMVLDDQGGSQISVRTDGKSPTLRAEMHGNVPCVLEAAGFKAGQGSKARSIGWDEERAPTLAAEAGGNSVPSVCIKEQHLFENHSQDSRYRGPLDVCPMLPAQLGTGGNNQPLVVEGPPTVCMEHGQANAEICVDKSPCLNCNHEQPIVVGMDCRNGRLNGDISGTLQAKPNGGFSYNCIHPVIIKTQVRYIVRRLTPTECARLQGFPDDWGHPDCKEDFTDEEYRFWLEVRNTHAAINGKAVKDYTKAQMLTWYNKLHTDSSEYKMWGNGISLPTALYVMQGIEAALKGASE